MGTLHHLNGMWVTVEGLNTYYLTRGSGKPVILIHGLSAHSFSWRKNLDPLAKFFHVYALDLKGLGFSDKPLKSDYSPEGMATFVIRFMDTLGIPEAALIGSSMGGMISLTAALKYPSRVTQLVLVASTGYPLPSKLLRKLLETPVLGEILIKFAGKKDLERGLRNCYYDSTQITPEVVEGYYLPYTRDRNLRPQLLMARRFGFHRPSPLENLYNQIQIPTLLIWGREDRIVPVQHAYRFHREIKTSQLVILEKTGHAPQEENAEEFNRIVIDFLLSSGVR
ncbi:MAG TPA: alpha/beta fold hydrolase [Candidatus Limnocylindrales bacterium]|nr:alpha/beta fold hydrolase [Candidatus Limnocylindrales bacterium]